MRKGFTLVELLVVVVVIVTLMAVTFRLGGAGTDSTAKARTINRMQRLENCLSGYYAAYGSYPPVALHGSRDYRYKVNDLGIQRDADSSEGEELDNSPLQDKGEAGWECWKRVEAACRSQPIGMSHPFCTEDIKTYIDTVSGILQKKARSNEHRYKAFRENPALRLGFSALNNANKISSASPSDTKWTKVQIFRYGLLSYLLPRLLVVCTQRSGDVTYSDFEQIYKYAQWESFNELPCRLESGQPYTDWNAVFSTLKSENERWKVAALPSQATCARWMPNLEGIVSGGGKYYGVDTRDDWYGSSIVTAESTDPRIYAVKAGSDQYMLDEKTVLDGWRNEFYYYSPPPHQSYTLWSAGPNGRTFPPWVNVDADLQSDEKLVAQKWMADDMMHMQN